LHGGWTPAATRGVSTEWRWQLRHRTGRRCPRAPPWRWAAAGGRRAAPRRPGGA